MVQLTNLNRLQERKKEELLKIKLTNDIEISEIKLLVGIEYYSQI